MSKDSRSHLETAPASGKEAKKRPEDCSLDEIVMPLCCLGARLVLATMDELRLQDMEEALHWDVVKIS